VWLAGLLFHRPGDAGPKLAGGPRARPWPTAAPTTPATGENGTTLVSRPWQSRTSSPAGHQADASALRPLRAGVNGETTTARARGPILSARAPLSLRRRTPRVLLQPAHPLCSAALGRAARMYAY